MQLEKAKMQQSCGFITVLLSLALGSAAAADDAKKSADSQKKKCCMSDVIKGCSDREQRTSQAIGQLMDKLAAAAKSDDPAKMKAAMEDAKKSLADMKTDHEKSGAALKKVHQRLQNLKKQIKATREEHDKASSIVDDEDMDDVIWAY